MLGGLAGMAAGVGTAAAIQERSPTAAAVVGVSGVVIGLVGVFGGLAQQPSAAAELDADARRRLFFPDEDDMDAVVRGVDGANARRRLTCGDAPSAAAVSGR